MRWYWLLLPIGVAAYFYRSTLAKLFTPVANVVKTAATQAYVGVTSAAMPMLGSPAYFTALLNLIARGEANRGYDSYYAGSRVLPTKPISHMTLAEVRAWQSANTRAGSPSSAVGRYQFITTTFNRLTANLPPSTLFTPTLQDQMAMTLIGERGLALFLSGTITLEQFASNLAHEWASLPVNATGVSAYQNVAGNRALVSWNTFVNTLMGA